MEKDKEIDEKPGFFNSKNAKNMISQKYVKILNQNCCKTGYGLNGRPLVNFKNLLWFVSDLNAGRKVCCYSIKDKTDEELCENCADNLEKYALESAKWESETNSGNDKIVGLLNELLKNQFEQNKLWMEENDKLNKKIDMITNLLSSQTHL